MRKFIADASQDALRWTADTASALIRFACALAFLMWVTKLGYHEAVEPAALLGMTAYFERPRVLRTGDDVRGAVATRIHRVKGDRHG